MEVPPVENILLIIIVGTTCFALVVVALFLFIRLYQNRMRDNENQILQLEVENRLRIIKSIMEAEENQKEAISKNLHDDVGISLNILKLKIYSLNEFISNQEDKVFINKSIDSIINNIRIVCYDLMPVELKLFGLNKALELFCSGASKQSKLNIQYTSNYNGEMQKSFEELVFYRLFKEILNNIIKHSLAKTINCNIEINKDSIYLLFNYDGKGVSNLEIENIKKTNASVGLNSIDSRLIVLNGNINYLDGEGISVNQIIITLIVNKKI